MGVFHFSRQVGALATAVVERLMFWWRLLIIAGALITCWQVFYDRTPPFKVLGVYPAQVYPGQPVTIVAAVWRDGTRRCSVDMDRHTYDYQMNRTDYPRVAFTADDIATWERHDPGIMRPTIIVSPNASCGAAVLVSNLGYGCNRAQALLWPIHVRTELPFEVLCHQPSP